MYSFCIVSQHSLVAYQAGKCFMFYQAIVNLHQFMCQNQKSSPTHVGMLCNIHKTIITFCATTIAKPEVAAQS